jgi:predicted Zn-dependent protease
MRRVLVMLALLSITVPVAAQLGKLKGITDQANKAKQAYDDYNFTDQEEQELGASISALLREKYGVVQDRAVHKYVALAGSVLASESTRPALKWTFIVLDTDGVNAFAAPGGFVHITRGALALIQSEAELADVLGHEIGHITLKHTIKAIQNQKKAELAASASRQAFLQAAANMGYSILLENKFDRNDEEAADKVGLTLGNKSGYSPSGLPAFLTKLAERNKGLKERSGVFASHPETMGRIDTMKKVITAEKLTATAMVTARYTSTISFKPVPVDQIAQVAPPTASTGTKAEEPKSSGSGKFGVSGLTGLGKSNSSNSTIASAGSRGLNPDRDAKGGPNKALVVVTVGAGEIAEFRKGITG